MSKNSVIILGLRVVTTCWSWAWTNRTSPSNGVGLLSSPLAACSVYGDLTCSVHTLNNLCLFNCQWYAFLCNWGTYVRLACMPNMLSSWINVIIIIIIKLSAYNNNIVQRTIAIGRSARNFRHNLIPDYKSHDMTKATEWACAQRGLKSAWASAQSDQNRRCAVSW